MTYTFKLARRLAISRKLSMVTALILLAACTGETTGPDADLHHDQYSSNAACGWFRAPSRSRPISAIRFRGETARGNVVA